MVTIIATHLRHPTILTGYRTIVSFSDPPTLEIIQRYIENHEKSPPSSIFTYVIQIQGHRLGPFLLDNEYISTYAPFDNKNGSEDEHVVQLEVTWIARQNTYPAQVLGKLYNC
jgi:hypothetical protein